MGLGQRKSKGGKGGHKTKNKQYKKGHATKSRRKDVDQIQDELKVEEEQGKKMEFELDDDLPGQGQFYCTPCARHFSEQEPLDRHVKSKVHKRRMKDVAQEQYTQEEAERGAGMVKEVYPPAHPHEKIRGTASQVAAEAASGSLGSGSTMFAAVEDEDDPDL
ncbi:unnamed protein product [Choristocarpus tenellus]